MDAQDIPNSNNERRLPNVLILNTSSLVSKTDELANFVELYKSNLVFVTETWLCDKIPDEAIQLPGMTSIRKDRIGRRGCGVVLLFPIASPPKHDMIFLNHLSNASAWDILRPTWLPRCISRIAVAVSYLPPSTTSEDVERFYDYFYGCYDILISESPRTSFIIAGDFNPTSNGCRPAKLARYSKLKQIIKNPTRGSNITRFACSKTHEAYVLNFRTSQRSVTRLSSDYNLTNLNVSRKAVWGTGVV